MQRARLTRTCMPRALRTAKLRTGYAYQPPAYWRRRAASLPMRATTVRTTVHVPASGVPYVPHVPRTVARPRRPLLLPCQPRLPHAAHRVPRHRLPRCRQRGRRLGRRAAAVEEPHRPGAQHVRARVRRTQLHDAAEGGQRELYGHRRPDTPRDLTPGRGHLVARRGLT